MEFNITNLDKVLLIQTLYAHADPKGLGVGEYQFRDLRNEMVSGISIAECKRILKVAGSDFPGRKILDYHNGKPIKLVFHTKPNGEIITDSSSYDERNGKFRFLEALLNVFDLEEILITKKGYPEGFAKYISETGPARNADVLLQIMSMLKHTDKVQDHRGTYWKFNPENVSYKPAFM
ncbi:MAG TPA: hypothetical protein VGE44_14625 [Daejeonella sp.]|uniref:hypothetical protein n=1 Tax=Daejeonella sp. TaxID=2805397 RepID=UPI002ED9E398